MRRLLVSVGGCLLLSAALSAAPCTPSATTLCLNDSRFEVEVSWRDARDRTGVGQAKTITADTGYFWFFSETNIELVIKVLDARSINQKYWVFFGALTSVEFDLTITDTITGAVKTYHNPLGQFASVGDTGAFDPSITAPRHEIVSSEGTSTPPESLASIQMFIEAQAAEAGAAFTPCAETGAALYLANCRFRLEVHWSDSRGRHGAGQPVQLTNDTGYFWFFSEENVELMVKVLDARGINDKFWVFFGALSSVEYTINVFDTVSGALRSYNNAQGAFASVGDTSAFRGGDAISIDTDESRAETTLITAAGGGSMSVSAADGTVFTLQVPPGAIFEDEEITMTPVRVTGSFPFAGGLSAGVDLQPSGLPFLTGATLSIRTPTPIPPSEETPVAWNGSGEDFYLFPPSPESGDLKIFILHLGGYGVARATDGERALQVPREPVDDDDLLSHQTAALLREGRTAVQVTAPRVFRRTSDWSSNVRAAYDNWYVLLRNQMVAADEPARVNRLVLEGRRWQARVETHLGPLSTVFPNREQELRGLFELMLRKALVRIKFRCRQDVSEITQLPMMISLIAWLDFALDAEIQEAIKCLTFELKFESKITATHTVGTVRGIHLERVAARVTLRPAFEGVDLISRGDGTTNVQAIVYPNPDPQRCSLVLNQGSGTFRARLVWPTWRWAHRGQIGSIDLNYRPGFPDSSVQLVCPYGGQPGPIEDMWANQFPLFHEFRNDWYSQGDWTVNGGRDPWALSRASKSLCCVFGTSFEEDTTFTLKHTPQ